MTNENMMDKYDHAIEFLREQDKGTGSYFEECASIIEELLGKLYEQEEELQFVRHSQKLSAVEKIEEDRKTDRVSKKAVKTKPKSTIRLVKNEKL